MENPIPESLIISHRLNLPKPLGEYNALKFIEEKLSKNKIFKLENIYLPDYPYYNYIPASVDYISFSTEFLTSYTPYQPEISQGLLQVLFEYQSLLCELTGMDVINASMYDHSTALSEALIMSMKYTGRNKVIIPYFMRKKRKEVIYTYLSPFNVKIEEYKINFENGKINLEDFLSKIDNETAAVYVEYPNYFGVIDDNFLKIADEIHSKNSLYIVGIEPISLSILKEPGSFGADIVVGEAQHLALNPYYGGPSLGILGCREEIKLVHLLPGRIVGATTTLDNSRLGYVLALQAREQHIRREKATSNICTNESWLAVRAAIFISLYGIDGLKRLAGKIFKNTKILAEKISKIDGIEVLFKNSVLYKNLLIKFNYDVEKIYTELLKSEIIFGNKIYRDFNELTNSLLVGVNVFNNEDSIDFLCKSIKEII